MHGASKTHLVTSKGEINVVSLAPARYPHAIFFKSMVEGEVLACWAASPTMILL